ncbi:hypothetical protein MHM98_11855 [Psychrobium sp. MM17-31]|uniref:hypothetical protein n=1 Tax=Psychrobium sp. MM17-31 TaxID=2917758 RepID=UPI001EF54348|nr:hypothetical protein [Psychrobium sp. MM17-31]MCG7532030.1 hypothetical protein [Psychrobium sp. MM17-31]
MFTPIIVIDSLHASNANKLIANVMDIVGPLGCQRPVIVCPQTWQASIELYLTQANIKALILSTPCEKGTTPALTSAALISLLEQTNATLAVFHHPQFIDDYDAFEHSLYLAAQVAQEDYLVTLDNTANIALAANQLANPWLMSANTLLDIVEDNHSPLLEYCQRSIALNDINAQSQVVNLDNGFYSQCQISEVDSAIFAFAKQSIEIPLQSRWPTVVPQEQLKALMPAYCVINNRHLN